MDEHIAKIRDLPPIEEFDKKLLELMGMDTTKWKLVRIYD